MKLKRSKFTHYARFYGIPCYFNSMSGEMAGRNILFDLLIPMLAGIHNYFTAPFDGRGFPIQVGRQIEDEPDDDI